MPAPLQSHAENRSCQDDYEEGEEWVLTSRANGVNGQLSIYVEVDCKVDSDLNIYNGTQETTYFC